MGINVRKIICIYHIRKFSLRKMFDNRGRAPFFLKFKELFMFNNIFFAKRIPFITKSLIRLRLILML